MAVCGEIHIEHLNNCGKIQSFGVKTSGAYGNHWASELKYEFEHNHFLCQNSVLAGLDSVHMCRLRSVASCCERGH
jgi:hypothetical protein